MIVSLTNNQALVAGGALFVCALTITAGLLPATCIMGTIFALAGTHFYIFTHEISVIRHPFGEYGMACDNNLPTSDYTRNLKAIIALSLILTLISQFIWWETHFRRHCACIRLFVGDCQYSGVAGIRTRSSRRPSPYRFVCSGNDANAYYFNQRSLNRDFCLP